MLRAAIFDMDGLLIDSEPLWQEAEVEVFGALGVPLSRELCRQTTGLRVDDVVRHWFGRHPWTGPGLAEVEAAVIDAVIDRIRERGEAKPGAAEALEIARDRGLRLALASSSSRRIIVAVLERLGLGAAFEVVRSGEEEPWGKPHPGIFLSTAAALDVAPGACLVLEDSLHGVVAAKAARMRCICVPEAFPHHDARLGLADAVVPSLRSIDRTLLDRIEAGPAYGV